MEFEAWLGSLSGIMTCWWATGHLLRTIVRADIMYVVCILA